MRSTAIIALASVTFLSVPALAQEYGTTDRPKRQVSPRWHLLGQSQSAVHGTSSALRASAVWQGDARQRTPVG